MRRIMSDDGFLFAPVDARPMRAFRACFGMLMVVHVLRLYVHGMYERAVLQPAFRFHYELFGVELVPLLPSTIAGAHCHLLVLAVAAFGVAVGIATRICAAIFATAYAAFILSDRTIFNNHYYLYWLMAMLFVLIEAIVDPHRGSHARATTAPRWQILTLRAQVVIVYAYAGVAKLNADWLLHSQPMATKLVDEAAVYTPRLRPLLEMHACHQLISLGGAVFDLAVGPCLLLPATRPAALFLACLFHASNHFLWSLGEFPWVMLATNLLFLDHWPEWLEVAQVAGRHSSAPASETARATGAAPGWAARAQVWAALLHTVTQLLLPLRPLAVSGLDPLDAVHTKAHTLLSWRMMAVSTRNFVNVSLRSEALGGSMLMTRTYNRMHLRFSNGSRVPLALSPYLSARQAGYMPYTAPMLVAFARDAARRHGCVKGRAPGGTAHTAAAGLTCRVEADLWSSINGRPLQRFVEATEDLAAATIGAAALATRVLPLLYEFGNTTAAPHRVAPRERRTCGRDRRSLRRRRRRRLQRNFPGGAPLPGARAARAATRSHRTRRGGARPRTGSGGDGRRPRPAALAPSRRRWWRRGRGRRGWRGRGRLSAARGRASVTADGADERTCRGAVWCAACSAHPRRPCLLGIRLRSHRGRGQIAQSAGG